MGIPELWDIIKEEDRSVSIALLAQEHYHTHRRPLRIAIDEADWRFNNVTQAQVYAIRESSNKPYQGIEKTMFYRICRLLSLNIQLLFVFDGPRRPWKRGKRGQGKINYEARQLLKKICTYFRIPCHEAPAEAEAECARLQMLGVVDAVFSQDSDSLMFGCSMLIRDDRVAKSSGLSDRSKENTKKSASTVRVVRLEEIHTKHGFDREGLVLFAMLCGGDYSKGLMGCGVATTKPLVRAGLGKDLCRCRTKRDCEIWRFQLIDAIDHVPQRTRFAGHVPLDFPDYAILKKYNEPVVSTDEQLLNLRGLQRGWDQPFDEGKLLELTSENFNIWGRLYMNWVSPILLSKALVARDPSAPKDNRYEIRFPKQRAKKEVGQDAPRPLLRKLTFAPFTVSTLTRVDLDEGENRGRWEGVRDKPFDPLYRVECELPEYLLQRALPAEVFDPLAPTPKAKRKRSVPCDDHVDPVTVVPKRARKTKAQSTPNVQPTPPRTKHMPKELSFVNLVSDGDDSDLDELEPIIIPISRTPSTPAARSEKRPSSMATPKSASYIQSSAYIVDLVLGEDDEDDENDEEFQEALRASLQETSQTPLGKQASGSKSLLVDRNIAWEDWEADPQSLFVSEESPRQIETKIHAQVPSASSSKATQQIQRTEASRKPSPSGIDMPAKRTPHWSLPSPSVSRSTGQQKIPTPMYQYSPLATVSTLQNVLPPRNQSPKSPPGDDSPDPTDPEQIRMNRLQHFGVIPPNANSGKTVLPSVTGVSKPDPERSRSSIPPRPAKKKPVIEYIDLTLD
ncbi:hypothetical protein P154DRAFT_572268 [Amniculicola lignicola CBS 123094]|uniref:XPG-I domain-containing protein n=1 Tax=Amniculicola lignicola CBS 123094 TaxID=1392246 RepID=A0A6A5WRA8_9PLEO|nr:hypothetical protein P154DRAFT_572268 [Amniculicola lignicola CBS 123094]